MVVTRVGVRGTQGRGARVQARVAAKTSGGAAARRRQWRGLRQGQQGGSALSYLLQQMPLHDTHGEEAQKHLSGGRRAASVGGELDRWAAGSLATRSGGRGASSQRKRRRAEHGLR